MFRSNPPKVFSKKSAVKIGREPTGEQPRRSTISKKRLCNFIEITPMHGCTPKESTEHLQNTSPWENTSGRLFLYVKRVLKDLIIRSYYLQFLKEIYSHQKINNK